MTIRADAHTPAFHRAAPPQLPVRCATTGSITISTGLNSGDTIDGITLVTGDRVLVKDNGNATNGIYIVGASPARAFDFEEGTAAYGAVINVVVGTANASTQWRCTNTTVPTIGSTTLTFAQLGSSGSTVDIEDEGSAEGAADTIDFTGAGVSVSFSGGTATVDVPGGGGSGYFSRRLMSVVPNAVQTMNVNSTAYLDFGPACFYHDWDIFPATHFLITAFGQSNAGGQTITMQLTLVGSPTDPISAGGNDLVLSNTAQFYSSGWIAVSDSMAGIDLLGLAMKGSNSTVDLSVLFLDIAFKW